MKKILIVENDFLLADLLTKKFELKGNECKLLHGGEEVLSVAQEFKPDVILLDLFLPGIDGFEVMQILHTDESTKNIPIIVLSNSQQDTNKEKASKLGASLYLEKAVFDLNEIEKKIYEQIS